MSYIGPDPAEAFTSYATETFTTSSTTSYTLANSVANENELALFINNVRQQPGSGKAYTASGTALTLSAATASTDTMYAIYLGRALQTSVPHTNSITSSMLGSAFFTGATDVGGAIADADLFLMDDGAGGTLRKTAASRLKTYVGSNTPNFFASVTSDQAMNDNTVTKIQFANEVFDTGSNYDASTNYRYTPGFSGKSFLGAAAWSYDAETANYSQEFYLYKNGSSLVYFENEQASGRQWNRMTSHLGLIVSHDADDYYEVYGKVNTSDSGSANFPQGSGDNAVFRNYFYGYKIIE